MVGDAARNADTTVRVQLPSVSQSIIDDSRAPREECLAKRTGAVERRYCFSIRDSVSAFIVRVHILLLAQMAAHESSGEDLGGS